MAGCFGRLMGTVPDRAACVQMGGTFALLGPDSPYSGFASARESFLGCTRRRSQTKLEKAKSPGLPQAAPTTENPGGREYSAASARIRRVVRVWSDI